MLLLHSVDCNGVLIWVETQCGRKKDGPPVPAYSSLINRPSHSSSELREWFCKHDCFILSLNVMLARYKPLPTGVSAHTVSPLNVCLCVCGGATCAKFLCVPNEFTRGPLPKQELHWNAKGALHGQQLS